MKSGDIYYRHERVWSEEEVKDMQPHPDEIFRHVYVKLIKHEPYDKSYYTTCDNGNKDGAWACYGSDNLDSVKSHKGNITNITYCTKFIRDNFERIYEV